MTITYGIVTIIHITLHTIRMYRSSDVKCQFELLALCTHHVVFASYRWHCGLLQHWQLQASWSASLLPNRASCTYISRGHLAIYCFLRPACGFVNQFDGADASTKREYEGTVGLDVGEVHARGSGSEGRKRQEM